jgi:DNA-directed RNA polymerase specialized sigma24 family protein
LRGRVRAGDPDAFAALFDEHAQAVYRYAIGLSGNWSAAEEVVSLTFLEAWRLRETVRPDGGSLRPWLLGIAVNVTSPARAAGTRRR